jgi:hypothetical protein
MRDWEQIVRRHLRTLKACSPAFAESVTEELANHLEERYEDDLRAGMPEAMAFERAMTEIEFGSITLKMQLLWEDHMRGFTRRVGLPGLLTFASAMAIAWVLDFVHIQPKTMWLSNGLFLSLPIVWLCLLPLCGALGMIVSRRQGGSSLDGMMAAGFPAAVMAIVLLLIFVAGWAISLFVRDYGWNWAFAVPGLALGLATYAVMTATALLLGAAAAEQAKKISARLA